MAKLTDDVQTFLVRQLACFLTPSEVAAAVAEEFGVEIGRQQAWKYHPANNPELAPKWRALFEATRAAFIDALRPASAAPSPGGRGVRRRPHQPAGADRQGRRAAGHDL